ncbi:amidohydrolase family protein [Haliscomenobacter hydrossis]|uniref:Amidohydrolase n=1 Tax=Haliscomenobacter hydrossis (strain ATCC 27775 / DSM 1100 / LMG 10767 / O) TaxID=760192 RepID=F4KVC5_HALH1|nr:amidohydrolase family protein [Haliscomenobacter hydrossis]AEE50251.1 amidohydrolase [Haliscomenobacter hydrossis DSM 1100]
MKIKFLSILLVFGWGAIFGQVAKPTKGTGTFALTNASIQTVTKGLVQGTLVIQNGKITALGANAAVPAGAQVIDCKGLTLYPGMIDGGTQLGLVEVSSVDVTNDSDELGDLTPQVEALTAVNPNATAIPVTRVNGVTTVIAAPAGGRFPGTASLINLVGYTPDQMFAGFKGMVMNFPSTGGRGGGFFGPQRSEEDLKKEQEKAVTRLNEIWEGARFYARIDSAASKNAETKVPYNPEMAALLPVVRGKMLLMIEVNRAEDIENAIKWVESKKITNVVFTGVAEGWRVADKLAKAKISVITGPVIALPTRSSDRYDKAYANAGLMHKAGVKVALRTGDTENVRNLPFHAGFAAAYGLGKEQALRAITIIPAEIFGVADKLGSLEVGKNATLFASTGDALETRSQIKYLFIDGWQVPLDSRHIQLYNEFLKRSPGLDK